MSTKSRRLPPELLMSELAAHRLASRDPKPIFCLIVVPVFPMGLSMLWESTEPRAALEERFGFDDFDQAVRWLTDALAERWAIKVQVCDRIIISAGNAIAWVQTSHGSLVAKWSRAQEQFVRLAATADLIHRLDQQGLPVAPPLSSVDGDRRVIIESVSRPLSMTVQPVVQGDLLDITDPTAVHAAGACLARCHRALSTHADPLLLRSVRHSILAPRQRVERWLYSEDHGRTAEASARLREQIAVLPEIDAQAQLVHNDYRASNIMTAKSRVTAVLDFDDVGLDYCVYDLAHAAVLLGTRFTDWQPTPRAARETLLTGYRSIRPLTGAEELWLDALILWLGITAVPPGDDPAGWANALSTPSS